MTRKDLAIDREDIERRYSDTQARYDKLRQLINQAESNSSKRLWLFSVAFFVLGVVVGVGVTQ